MTNILYREDFPAKCIADCSSAGDVSEAVEYWVDKLKFQPDPEAARDYLRGTGAYDDEALADDEANARRVLWLVCCEFADGEDIAVLEG